MLIDEDFINYEDIHPYLNYLVKKIKVKNFFKKNFTSIILVITIFV